MDSSAKLTVIADSQYLIVRSLEGLVRERIQSATCKIIYTVQDLEKFLEITRPLLLIIDINNFEFDSIAEVKRILFAHGKYPVLVISNSITRSELLDLNLIGIRNILLKNSGEDEIIMAIEQALQGKKYYAQEIMDILLESDIPKKPVPGNLSLTGTEIEIVRNIAEGMTTKEIAMKKHVSFHTIMTHRKNIFRKAKVNNASELVMFAIRAGIIDIIDYQI